MTTNEELYQRGLQVIPGGVNSPVRAFRSVGGTPYFVESGRGSRVRDVEGREFIDYVQSYGASILGHAHPMVVEAIQKAATRGSTFGAPTEGEVRMAEEIVARIPGLEQVRLVSSGTEATMSAIRLARGVTGRDRIVKFEGNYHGHSDALLAAAGSGVAEAVLGTEARPDSGGVTPGAVADTIVLPYNVVPRLDESVAVVIVEPLAANMGLVPPVDGFLAGLRAECTRVGALLLFDEVITGFRICVGGATEWSGVTPDLWCFGKVIGGGLPVGAFGATAEIMAHLAPLGSVYQAGTLSGNPLATAAGLTVLSQLDAAAYDQLSATADTLAEGLRSAFAAAGVPAVVPRVGPLLGVFFGPGGGAAVEQPVDFATAAGLVAVGRYPAWFHGMLDRGIALAPGPYEVLFPSLAHTAEDVEATIAAAHEVAATL
ncbi:glutamate-1-semialdehyde 2,1-aminomutase [Dermatobacter hominis]|uniref:glutamate-1-semialdehyde 2,1-aminomutase n=1 Tax=Dermatobacter hominis TaxID=2884263 RepID=UPI001D0F4C3B|nr:glutamate-1-semialdehyde 2,1-aminomutase [Dermatobacter hominis]UDY33993.1 glutamate-1-semialdehyde 2,1-aminomutase [Dermatobacter hominis]